MKTNKVEIKKEERRISRNGFGTVWVLYIDGNDTEEYSRKWEACEAKELVESGKITSEDWNIGCFTSKVDRYKCANGYDVDSRDNWVRRV